METKYADLEPRQWLTDETINNAFTLIEKTVNADGSRKCITLSSFFLTSIQEHGIQHPQKVLNKMKPLDYDVVLIPVNIDNYHWAFVYIRNNMITFVDSLRVVKAKKAALDDKEKEILHSIKSAFEFVEPGSDLRTNIESDHSVKLNGYDCGVFVILFAIRLVRNKDLNIPVINSVLTRKALREAPQTKNGEKMGLLCD